MSERPCPYGGLGLTGDVSDLPDDRVFGPDAAAAHTSPSWTAESRSIKPGLMSGPQMSHARFPDD
jgi:hypothetical protein